MMHNYSSFLELLQSYFNQHLPIAVGSSINTIKSYKYTFRLLMEFLYSHNDISASQISFADLGYETITQFLDWIEKDRHCSASTKNQRLSALLSFSAYAQNRDFEAAEVFRCSVVKVPMKKTSPKTRAVFTTDEVAALLRLPDDRTKIGYRDKVLLSVMYASGGRAQEICDLKTEDILTGNTKTILILHGKGGKVRRIGIPDRCARVLKEYVRHKHSNSRESRYVFSSQTHEHMTVSCIEGIFKKYVRMAKNKFPEMFREKSYPPHSMRHSTASHMLEASIPLVVIKNFLGHASLQTTQIYAELSQNTVDRHLKAWNEKWFPTEEMNEDVADKCKMPGFLKV